MFWGCDTIKDLQWLFLNGENILAFMSVATVSDPDPVMAVTAEVEARREGEE